MYNSNDDAIFYLFHFLFFYYFLEYTKNYSPKTTKEGKGDGGKSYKKI